MSIERFMALVLLAGMAALLALQIPGTIRVLGTYLGTARRRQVDATGMAPAPGDDLVERLQTLASLGYHPIGETHIDMPLGDLYSRVVASDDGDSYALLVEIQADPPVFTGFYTAWPDGMWLGTLHPQGDALTRPGLELHVVGGALADAEAAHRAGVERLRASHGVPHRIERLTDVLARDADYRQRFGGRELRPLVVRALLPTAVVLVLTLAAVVVVAVSPP
jgi:hypothetical protein